jgi:glycosyltransferase involved in cell wall biosynthesis
MGYSNALFMQVCLDYQPAVAQRAGIGRYTRLLARHMVPLLGTEDALRLFYLDFTRKAEAPDLAGVENRPWRLLPGAWVQQLWKRIGFPPFDALAGRADLYHFTNFIIPPLSRGKAVVSIHDMSFVRLPECAEARNRAYLQARIGRTIRRADAIITISQFSADEIAACYPEAAGKTYVTYLGIDGSFGRPDDAAIAAMRRRLGLERPYILSVGTVEPRKNYPLLVEAFDALDRDDVDLVIAGMPGWNCEAIFEAFAKVRRAKQIRYLRFVPEGDLASLYAGAALFALASRYEGFGFTPLEAMACGTPVVSSPGGSLPEVLGDAALIVPEYTCEAWCGALRQALDDGDLRARLVARGHERALRYRWPETARRTWSVYRHVLGLPPAEVGA